MLPSPFRVSCEILSSINLLPPDSLPLLLPYFLPSSAHLPLSMRSSLMSSDIAESLLKIELFLLNVVAFSDTMLLFLLDRLEYVERSLVSELVLTREKVSMSKNRSQWRLAGGDGDQEPTWRGRLCRLASHWLLCPRRRSCTQPA